MRASIRVCVRDDNKRSWKAGLEGEGEGEGDWKREDRGRERERESARERGQVKGLCHSSPGRQERMVGSWPKKGAGTILRCPYRSNPIDK